MGRRSRKIVTEDKNEDEEDTEQELDEQELEINKEDLDYERFESIRKAHCAIMRYREEHSLPLCEYLDFDMFMDFVNSL